MDCHWDIPCISYCFCCKKLLKWPQRTSHSLSVYISETDESSQPVIDPIPNTNKPTETIEIKVDSGDTETNESKENSLTVDLPNDSDQIDNPNQTADPPNDSDQTDDPNQSKSFYYKCVHQKSRKQCFFQFTAVTVAIAMFAGSITIIVVSATKDTSDNTVSESAYCETDDPLPALLTYAGWCMLGAGLVGTGIISRNTLNERKTTETEADKKIAEPDENRMAHEFRKKHVDAKLNKITTALDAYGIYCGPALHFTDTMTDFAAAAEFYLISEEYDQCC